ncbi:MAG: EcsC family protein [Brachybacterium sp.]|nr:EcsC family protein [Brachybacterium sp.]
MGIFSRPKRDQQTEKTTREALKEARSGRGDGGALERMVESFRDIGIDGRLAFSSAADVAKAASKGRGKNEDRAIRRIVGSHRRGVTVGGFLTGLGGFVTLPVMLPGNVVEFYVQATRMVAAIAAVRGYDIDDEEIRTRVLATLVGEEADDVLKNVGLGPVAGVAARQVAKRMPASPSTAVARAIGARILRRFGLRSVRLFGKAVPGLGGIIGAWGDRRALRRIEKAALEQFPPQKRGKKGRR